MIATGICYSIELDQFCHSPTKRRECRETTSSEPGNWSRLFLHRLCSYCWASGWYSQE